MNRFTIYCTEAQTRQALKLDAPIQTIKKPQYSVGLIAKVTAEQMIGWLEEQGFYFNLNTVGCSVEIDFNCIYENHSMSRREATLAAIDAALERLIKNKRL